VASPSIEEEIEGLHFNHGLIVLQLYQGQPISIEIGLVPAEVEDECFGRRHKGNPGLGPNKESRAVFKIVEGVFLALPFLQEDPELDHLGYPDLVACPDLLDFCEIRKFSCGKCSYFIQPDEDRFEVVEIPLALFDDEAEKVIDFGDFIIQGFQEADLVLHPEDFRIGDHFFKSVSALDPLDPLQ